MHVIDFEKKTTCNSPFKQVKGVGCLWLYYKKWHSFNDGSLQCQKKNGTVFEFENYQVQEPLLHSYLLENGCKLSKMIYFVFFLLNYDYF